MSNDEIFSPNDVKGKTKLYSGLLPGVSVVASRLVQTQVVADQGKDWSVYAVTGLLMSTIRIFTVQLTYSFSFEGRRFRMDRGGGRVGRGREERERGGWGWGCLAHLSSS